MIRINPTETEYKRQAARFITRVRNKRRQEELPKYGKRVFPGSDPVAFVNAHCPGIKTLGLAHDSNFAEAFDILITKFERLSYWLHQEYDLPVPRDMDRLRPYIYKQLAEELAANAAAFHTSANHGVAATLYNGDITNLITDKRFERVRQVPSYFKQSLMSRATNPEGFLCELEEDMRHLQSQECLADLPPSVIAQAIVSHPDSRKSFLEHELKKPHTGGHGPLGHYR